MFKLIPVVEVEHRPLPFHWASAKPTKAFVELSERCSDADIAWVVGLLASYNHLEASGSIDAVADAISKAESLILPGGLMVKTENLEIPPSCCCGLEDWREWFEVAPGGPSPWLGHDPSPGVECKSDLAIIWADGDKGDRSPRVSVSYAEMEAARRSAETALLAFSHRLSDWLSGHTAQSEDMVRRFSEAFDLK